MATDRISFQFISEPGDVNFGGKVHGGTVMKWIDQTAYTCARTWSGSYCVTVYVGGIRFIHPINIGDVVRVDAHVIHTGRTSIHIAVDVYSKSFEDQDFQKKTHCIIVFVAVDVNGKPIPVKKWIPKTEKEKKLQEYAQKLVQLRKGVYEEMKPFLQ